MILGDMLILTQKGLRVSNDTLATIGIFPNTQVHMLPFRTFEYRETEPGYYFPMDLLVTPIPPQQWPFVMRFLLRLRNQPGTLQKASNYFNQQKINILFSESSRSGHHHVALNVLAEAKELEIKDLQTIYDQLLEWKENRKHLFQSLYKSWSDKNEAFPSEDPNWWIALKFQCDYFAKLSEEEIKIDDAKKDTKRLKDEVEQNLEKVDRRKLDQDDELLQRRAQYIGQDLAILSYENKSNCSIKDLLELTISRSKPEIRSLKMQYDQRQISAEKLYYKVEEVMVFPKLLLSIIMTYKRMLCEKYKILLIWDSLQEVRKNLSENRKLDTIPKEVYLYNIQYYKYVLSHPNYCETDMLSSSDLSAKRVDILNALNELPQDRKGFWDWEPRLDLDPVVVNPVESLCHASYHRAYDDDFSSTAQDSMVPFPESLDYPQNFLNNVLSQEKPATVAIASRNTEDLTLRLCLLPVTSLRRFVQIDLEYKRICFDQCKFSQSKNESIQSAEENKCGGSSLGLLSAWTKTIYHQPCDESGVAGTLNIWRTFNKTYEISNNRESGNIYLLAQATEKVFDKFMPDMEGQLKERLQQTMKKELSTPHIKIVNIKTKALSGGRVFVSLPFSHPKTKEWLQCVKDIGYKVGFMRVDTVETYTEPVTRLVAESLKQCHAMIQILALPIKSFSNQPAEDQENYSQKLIWLHAEYLTAVTNGLKVVRIIDENSIDERELQIGRDHPNFKFSVMKPSSDFEDCIRRAFEHLRIELAHILGLG
ncbi:MAG: hypothetical protein ONB46_13330 [candidate division KSB1 bacterium]|nr:hypothetical protein [candidate division KSB1 bacterium]MDZ7366695.1 hypothetical protein [candidate division KSB1 bacterium]MDZ7404708.1 hypothetical protein [candidate division KSB1 bacterium]